MKQNCGVAHTRQGVFRSGRHPFLLVRSTFSSRAPYATHFHDCLSLGVLFEGETELRRGGGAARIRPGQMVLIAPMEPHSCNPPAGRGRGYHMLYIDAGWALGVLGAPAGSRLVVAQSLLGDNRGDSGSFAAMTGLAEAIRGGRGDDAGCDALAGIIAAHCGFCPDSDRAVSGHAASGYSASVDSVSDRYFSCQEASGEKTSEEEAARELGMRRESFIRSFHRATGMTPAKYRQCLRLIRAGDFLRRGHGIAETALACGYADQSHFHRMCVKYLAATPVQMTPAKPRKSPPPEWC